MSTARPEASVAQTRAAQTRAAIDARGVTVAIDGRTVLDAVDFRAERGLVHALIGPNGAGKSTLLSALAGDLRLTAGRVDVDGRELSGYRLRDLARIRAVLPQEHGVFFPFTVGQVIEMGRSPWARTEAEARDDEIVRWAAATADVSHLVDRTVPTLSGGERGRAAFARVLAQTTGVLLLDEPTAALDIRHQEALLTTARERADAGDAVVVVLHDLGAAAAYADVVTLLSHGRVVATGPVADVMTAERLTEIYGHPIDVLPGPIVLPRRTPRGSTP
ncbi:heme ABC transporter ATP-binding protein [Agromyces aerolatus]|uniref:heme ABC transporter ATP-binding protein n=1 Tax=Agromyces sp. LY-1074 TaxID=3074080 RepID=UPI00285C02EE|nr:MULTISPECIES: heme ABC transporter ATP-binding protein [unclassified Agromyces]MDR5698731.1 heme ABC transporter ATP-binding protein [Agromyces sp. LY-1074]MDR5705025.1 heme ABC transporter ATP-binding protein [Agromyces sp. LY-1358]